MAEIAPVEVTMKIPVPAAELFGYLTDAGKYVQWMGSEATLDPSPGGVYRIRMPDGFEAAGQFLTVEHPRQVVFTWGFADEDAAQRTKRERAEPVSVNPMPAGSTRVTVTLTDQDGRTLLTLRHEDLPSAELRDGHDVAWNTYLPRLVTRATGGDPGPDPHS